MFELIKDDRSKISNSRINIDIICTITNQLILIIDKIVIIYKDL